MPEMVYREDGSVTVDTDRVILVDSGLAWTARTIRGFVSTAEYRHYRVPIDGEIGSIGCTRVVVSDDPGAVRDVATLYAAVA